ncbi:hypothetical protein ACRCQ7_33840, partial [Pseudomonas aeruginosa]
IIEQKQLNTWVSFQSAEQPLLGQFSVSGNTFKYVVLLGLDAFDPDRQQALMFGFKDRLLADIREESFEAWKRKHIADCVVLSVDSWNQHFPEWPLRREAPVARLVPEGVLQ